MDAFKFFDPRDPETGWLSNFCRAEFRLDGLTWPTVEHAYQASWCVKVAPPWQQRKANLKIQLEEIMPKKVDEQVFFSRFHSDLDDLEMRMHGFAHYIQGALAAEQAAGPNPGWLENADATRCAIKWEVEDGELLKSCQSLLSAMAESDVEAKERPPEVVLKLIALILVFIGLYAEMESFRGTGKGESAYQALGNSATLIFESIHTLRRNVERKLLA